MVCIDIHRVVSGITRLDKHISDAGKEILSLWLEYEDCTTPEATVVKDFDK